MIEAYRKHAAERQALGIPPRPLDPDQTRELCALLERPEEGEQAFLLALLRDRVSPGVDPAAEVKAAFLGALLRGEKKSGAISPEAAVEMLGTMMGGYNVPPLLLALEDPTLSGAAVRALARTTYIHDGYEKVLALSGRLPAARKVLKSWASAEWFTSRPKLPEAFHLTVFKVDGEINTDDFSPASDAATRPDIPLHALSMGKSRFPSGLAQTAAQKAKGGQGLKESRG